MMYVFHFEEILNYTDQLKSALEITLKLASGSIICTLLVSALMAYGVVYSSVWMKRVINAYIEIIRNTPILIQLFLVFYGAPLIGIRLDSFTAAMAGIVINSTAYTTEIFRGGIQSIDKGQREAARVLGLSPLYIYFMIVFPQSLRAVYPAMTNQMIVLLLNTSVCSFIALNELTAESMSIASDTYRMFEVYISMAGMYLILTVLTVGIFKSGEYLFLKWDKKS